MRVSDYEFRWHVHRKPQLCTVDGWKGLTLHVELADEPQRALILEFPHKGVNYCGQPDLHRPSVSERDVIAGISSALAEGWKPESRGKPFVHALDDANEDKL